MNKGPFTSAPTSGIVPEDFYLNKNDGYIYLYNGSTWSKITDYTDSKYLQAMNDMLSISNSSTNNSLITATNAHIENLATRNILANKIATQTINLNSNGLIKSNNFVSFTLFKLISKTPELIFYPADEHQFKMELLKGKKAHFVLTYSSGKTVTTPWNASSFDAGSNLRGNIQSRPFWRNKNKEGLVKVEVRID